ncbi:MAG: hypothetical protein IJ599_03015 [Alphaproteobacteria bacterium]|nr:hypothetical protein [Alphaproteobacteria bacterium]
MKKFWQITRQLIAEQSSRIIVFSERGEEKALICRAAVKLEGRSPESKR